MTEARPHEPENDTKIVYWRRTDLAGLERLALTRSADSVAAVSTVICVEDGGFRVDHRWKLTPDWRALSVDVEKWGRAGKARLSLERSGRTWKVDGIHHPDLDDAEEPDLSVTPFSNTLPIRQLTIGNHETLTLDTCYIDTASMTVVRSRQQYQRLGPKLFRYVDLGLAAGFEAELQVDPGGLITSYQHLFERVTPH